MISWAMRMFWHKFRLENPGGYSREYYGKCEDMLLWCANSIDKDQKSWDCRYETEMYDGDLKSSILAIKFRFKNKQDYVMFKLTWA